MDKNSIINFLPLDDLEKEIISLLSTNKSEDEIMEILIKRFSND